MRLAHWILAITTASSISIQETRGTFRGLLAILAWTFFWVTLLTGLSLASPRRRIKPQRQTPVSRLDVRALGYTVWSPLDDIQTHVWIGQICFSSDNQIILTFISHVVPAVMPRRSKPDVSSNVSLNALFVDAKSGQLRARRAWPTSSVRSRIAPVTGGKFVVITPDKSVLYSSSMQPLKELSLPVGREATVNDWQAKPSTGGRYLLISYGPRSNETNPLGLGGEVTRQELIDTETLSVTRSWTEKAFGVVQAVIPLDSGKLFAYDRSTRHDVIGSPPDGPWRLVLINWPRACKPNDEFPIGDHAFSSGRALSIDRRCESLATTNGVILFSHELGEKEIGWHRAVSANGQRFADAIYKGKGGSWLLDIPAHYTLKQIRVYDIAARRWIYTLDGKKQGIKTISGQALSPDGSLLALIDQDGILQVYRIPQTPSPPRKGR